MRKVVAGLAMLLALGAWGAACGLGATGLGSDAQDGGGGGPADGSLVDGAGSGNADASLGADGDFFPNEGGGGFGDDSAVGDAAQGDADATTVPDARVPSDSGATEGGQSPTPGTIECAGTSCALGANVCCACPGCFPPFPTRCTPAFPGCVGSGTAMQCDDRTDCPADAGTSEACCAAYSSSIFSGSSCKAACSGTDVQLCNVDAECPAGRTCAPSSAMPGFSACQ